jgi:hypothetical protein
MPVVIAEQSLVWRPAALFEVKGKIAVDTVLYRFIMILIR